MNALILVISAVLVLTIAYRYYAAFLAAKVLVFEPSRPTPSKRFNDGHDYFPTNRYILFGHHFAAISGPGPLVGPVLAAQFGFLPGLLWILIGAALAGAVHDLVTLFASVRYDGRSLTEIARRLVGPLTGICTAAAVIFIIITALAGLGIVVVNALAESPWGTFAISVSIPAALIVGLYLHALRHGRVAEASVIGVALLCFGVIYGAHVQHAAWGRFFLLDQRQLALALPTYGFIASVLPVWLLLCPRDYLSSYMKIGVVLMLGAGIILLHPHLKMPAVTPFIHGGGPVIPGRVWPFVCITIACGAISGFHALVSSGTTPKMVSSEADVRFIGFGAMLLEAFVAVMALIAATVLVPADYFAINATPETLATVAAKFPSAAHLLSSADARLDELTRLVGEKTLAGRVGGAVSLAVGMSYIFSSIGGLKHLMSYWYHFAIMFEALFILTTIDTGTRVARYCIQDVLSNVHKRFSDARWWPGVAVTSFLVCFAWGYLVYGGNIRTIWPMFGVANQLLATLVLAVCTTFILSTSPRRVYALCTFLPFCFMLATTLTAGWLNVTTNYLTPQGLQKGGALLAGLTIVMMALVAVIAVDSVRSWVRVLSRSELAEFPPEVQVRV
ncbi:MAG: carbon starvation CstA family protein [Armatimonadota bacterium]